MKILVIIIASVALLSSCKKYPDGPTISLKTKSERLANSWKLKQYFEDGFNKTANINILMNNYNLIIDKGGKYSLSYKAFGILNITESGTWAFSSDKSRVTFTKTTPLPQTTSVWTILRLKEDELWGQYTDSSKVIKVELVP